MKRLFSILFTAALLSVFAAGCDNTEDKSANADIPVETEAVTEATEETTEPERKYTPQRGDFLYDDAGVLSPSDFKAVNQTAADFTAKYRVNTGVVITDNTGEKAPKDLAAELHSEMFGFSNGLLLLINNDTGKDYVLRRGSPSEFISDSDIQMLFADISPLLVTGDYSGAVTETFELFEKNIPEYITDRTNTLSKEDMLAVNEMLSGVCGENEMLSMVYMSAGADDIEKYADAEAARNAADSRSTAVLFVNPENGMCTLRASGSFSQLGEAGELFKTAVADYFVKEGGDPVGLAELYINFAGK